MDSYKEYMIDLLHAPFKKVKREVNHWKILMQVLGEEFDQVKESIFRIRDESAIHTATSSRALDMIGDGMRMKRFEGEDDERFRKRLLAKRAIAEMAGTRSGIRYAMKSLGFEEVEILPPMDPLHPDQKDMQRWAEFILRLNGKRVPIEHRKQWEIIQSEVRRVKQASSKLAGISIIEQEQTPIFLALHNRSLKKILSPPARIEQMIYSLTLSVSAIERRCKRISAQMKVVQEKTQITQATAICHLSTAKRVCAPMGIPEKIIFPSSLQVVSRMHIVKKIYEK